MSITKLLMFIGSEAFLLLSMLVFFWKGLGELRSITKLLMRIVSLLV